MTDTVGYIRRILDDELDELLLGLSAVAIEGPKAIGKTATALRRARTVHELDDPVQYQIAVADPERLLLGETPCSSTNGRGFPSPGTWSGVRWTEIRHRIGSS